MRLGILDVDLAEQARDAGRRRGCQELRGGKHFSERDSLVDVGTKPAPGRASQSSDQDQPERPVAGYGLEGALLSMLRVSLFHSPQQTAGTRPLATEED